MYQRPRRVYRRRQHRVYATSHETAPGLLWKPGDRAGSTLGIRDIEQVLPERERWPPAAFARAMTGYAAGGR